MLLDDLNVVIKVAEFRNITAAATHLNMRTATASAAVKRVEQALGAELFVRTTRSLRLSSAGERFLPTCEQAMLMLTNAKQNLKGDTGIIEGELRLGLSSDLGRNVVAPWLDDFMDEHDKVSVKLNLNDSNIDFYRDPIDLALRYGSPDDASVYGFKICDVPRLLVASPSYIARHGALEKLEDLQLHNGLFYQLHDKVYNEWELLHQGKPLKIKMHGNRTANDGEMVRRWAVAGKGVAVKSGLDICDDITNGRLITLLPDYQPKPTQLWLICPSRQSITPAVRLLRDMLKTRCAECLVRLKESSVVIADKG
ncbi:LysR family transcriptional regulator [Alteromonas macleodii]|jgi:DNA-binding transcriptional LysR family regulator|uniref:LysR family transcriptional regulator n=1 Tax=Alteromonas macleodii TaxID=28108 RepID=UPI001930C0B1|nr:LysR family transcriptional regulator [Alteromonas macleodii]|tara:strand:+ start:162 stop:1094 length:933 start_codon:yes stop_codon:yes gene_type:complete